MAGSMAWFRYTSDNGQTYALKADRTNVADVNASGAAPATALPNEGLPRNIKPRYGIFSDTTGNIVRRVPILTPADLAALTADESFTPPEEAVLVRLTFIKGEEIRLPRLVDTGRTN